MAAFLKSKPAAGSEALIPAALVMPSRFGTLSAGIKRKAGKAVAEDFLEEIYREAALYTDMKCLVEMLESDRNGRERDKFTQIYSRLEEMCSEYAGMDPAEGMELQNDLKKIREHNGDFTAIADTFTRGILPRYERYLSRWNQISVDDEQGYCLESSFSGFLTIRDTESGKYLHSRNDPMWEARQKVRQFYDPALKSYSLLGCGLGYIAYQLYCISDGSVPIHIYEYDEKMIRYAREYGVLDWIPEECLHVTVDADVLPFLYSIEEGNGECGYYIFSPEIDRAPDDAGEIMRSLLIESHTHTAEREKRRLNIYRNMQSGAKPFTSFDKTRLKDRFIVVAGGPSVDDSLEFIRQQKEEMSVIAVGTVFRKLLSCGIVPDFAAILDPSPFLLTQLEGIEEQNVPLFLGLMSYWKLARNYKGERYLVPSPGSMPEEQDYIRQCEGRALNCSGTVTVLAVSLAQYFGAREIYLTGADFSFPEGRTYTKGAVGAMEKGDTLFPVERVGGGSVLTDRVRDIYRKDMEELIENTPDVTFYNLSGIGARIAGTVEIPQGE